MGVPNKNEPRPEFFSAGHQKRDWDWWESLKIRELEAEFRHVPSQEQALFRRRKRPSTKPVSFGSTVELPPHEGDGIVCHVRSCQTASDHRHATNTTCPHTVLAPKSNVFPSQDRIPVPNGAMTPYGSKRGGENR